MDHKSYQLSSEKELFQVIASDITFSNSTVIEDEEFIINSLISGVTFKDSFIRNINYEVIPARSVASTFIIETMQFENITTHSSLPFMIIGIDSVLTVNGLLYQNSTSMLFRTGSCTAEIASLTIQNITDSPNLFRIESDTTNVFLSDIKIVNSTVKGEHYISLAKSQVNLIKNLTASGAISTLLEVTLSNITKMEEINISSSLLPLKLISSTVNEIIGSTFKSNGNINISVGGAIDSSNSNFTIKESVFKSNLASKGGAINFECHSLANCYLSVSNTTFESNQANIKGGAIHYNYKRPVLLSISFVNNSAEYGPNLASYPVKISQTGTLTQDINLNYVGSGVAIETPIMLSLYDFDNQVIKNQNDQIEVLPKTGYYSSIGGTTTALVKNGTATFDNIVFSSDPGSSGNIHKLKSEALDDAKIATAFEGLVQESYLNVSFRYCKPGEYITSSNTCSN